MATPKAQRVWSPALQVPPRPYSAPRIDDFDLPGRESTFTLNLCLGLLLYVSESDGLDDVFSRVARPMSTPKRVLVPGRARRTEQQVFGSKVRHIQ